MAAPKTPPRSAAPPPEPAVTAPAGCRVYGVLPAGAPAPTPEIRVVQHRQIAALVGPATAAGARRELLAHARLLDTAAATTPVLPVRFGTVLASPEAVERNLLAPHHDAFVAALGALTGRAQFTVRARYEPDAIVREVLDGEPTIKRLHQQLGRRPGGPVPAGQVRLGELVARAIVARREVDTRTLADSLGPVATLTTVQAPEPVSGYRIATFAFLVELARQGEFEHRVGQLAGRWRARVRLRLLGPMAAYHFADRLMQLPPAGG